MTNRKKKAINNELNKAYPNTDLKGKYILWIAPDLLFKYENYGIDCEIKVLKENNEEIQIPHKMTIRTPYPNKTWKVAGLKIGNKKTFGIPLVFNSIEELMKVNKIIIKWDGYYPTYLFNHPNLTVTQINIIYNVKIKPCDTNNLYHYSLHTRDCVFGDIEKEQAKHYMNKYSINIMGSGDIAIWYDETNNDDYGLIELFSFDKGGGELDSDEERAVDYIEKTTLNEEKIREILENTPELEKSPVEDEVNYYKYYYEADIILEAEECANIDLLY